MKRNLMLDEAQEQTLLLIESRCFWLVVWSLYGVILFKNATAKSFSLQAIAGEVLVLDVVVLYFIINCLKNGIWSRVCAPNPKSNWKFAGIAGLIGALFNGIVTYVRLDLVWAGINTAIFSFFWYGTLGFITITIYTKIYYYFVKKKEAALDALEAEDSATP